MSWKSFVPLMVFALICGVGAWVVSGARARGVAEAEAEALRQDVSEARALADVLGDSIRAEKEKSERLLEELEEERRGAAEEAMEAEASAASLRAEAERTGREALEALQAALRADTVSSPPTVGEVIGLLEAHLRADSLTVEAWEARIDAEIRGREIAERTVSVWQARAELAERGLGAREMECRLCEAEAERWRALANPGFFERVRRNLPMVGGSIGLGSILTMILIH